MTSAATHDKPTVTTADDSGTSLRAEILAIGLITAIFLALGMAVIALGAPFGHDEAVYGLRGRTLAGVSTSEFYWRDYRAPGLPALLAVASLLDGDEMAFRAVVLLFGAGGLVLTWLLGRTIDGPHAGIWSAGALAVMPQWLVASTQALPDVPGGVVGLVALLAVALFIRRGGGGWLSALAVTAATIATVFRYGAPIAIGASCATLVIVWWRAAWPLAGRVVALGTAMLGAMAAVLLWPPLTGSNESPFRAVRDLTERADTGFFVRPASDLLAVLPESVGWVPASGLLLGVALIVKRVAQRRRVGGMLLGLTLALGTALTLFATLTHGEARYLAPVLPLLALFVGAVLARLMAGIPPARLVALTPLVVLLGMGPAHSEAAAWMESLSRGNTALRGVSQQLRHQNGDCAVVSSYNPQVEWYSGCPSSSAGSWEDPASAPAAEAALPSDTDVFVIAVERGKRQPEDEQLFSLADEWAEELVAQSMAGSRAAWLWRITTP